jgi:ribosome maturation factor RimP
MDKSEITENVRRLAARAAAENNLELVHVETVGNERQLTVRVFIDKPEAKTGNSAVTHEDCARLSLHLGTLLDVEDFIQPSYNLEVSSPGIERELFSLKDYERFAGHNAKIKTRRSIGNQRNFRGKIAAVKNEVVVFEDKTNGQIEIPLNIISKANLEVDWKNELK